MNQIKSSIKVLAIILVMLVSINKVQSQVSIGVQLPSGSAMLDVSSTTKGFLPPRMSEIQRALIFKPDAGLIVYQTDGKKGIYYYDGTSWTYVMNQLNTLTPDERVVALGGVSGNISTFGTVVAAPTFITSEWMNVGGFAGKLRTPRRIFGNTNLFDGTADLTSNLLSAGITSSTTLAVGGASTLSGNLTVSGTTTLNGLIVNGTITGSMTGNASTATKLATARNINGVAFDGSSDITVIANAGTLTGTVLKSTITGSSLTSVGTITSGVWSGTAVAVSNGGTGLTSAGLNGQILTSTGSGTLTWTTPSTGGGGTHTIGESFGGGKVFYVTIDGLHGLIAETVEQSICSWYDAQDVISNSVSHSAAGILYTDWRLPTKNELNLLYLQKSVVGVFANNKYWSSSELGYGASWFQDFTNGNQDYRSKNDTYYVRAIRAF